MSSCPRPSALLPRLPREQRLPCKRQQAGRWGLVCASSMRRPRHLGRGQYRVFSSAVRLIAWRTSDTLNRQAQGRFPADLCQNGTNSFNDRQRSRGWAAARADWPLVCATKGLPPSTLDGNAARCEARISIRLSGTSDFRVSVATLLVANSGNGAASAQRNRSPRAATRLIPSLNALARTAQAVLPSRRAIAFTRA